MYDGKGLEGGLGQYGKPLGDQDKIIRGRAWMRRYWVDELPQVWNLINGELTLVGVRPKQEEVWAKFPKEHVERVKRHKPGLFGVQYTAPSNSFEDTLAAEKQFLDDMERCPGSTKLKYFFRIMQAIIFKGVRSK